MSSFGLLFIARRNIQRRLFRTLVLVISVGIATALLFSTSLLTQGVQEGVKLGSDRLGADILVVPQGTTSEAEGLLLMGSPTAFYMNKDVVNRVASIEGVKQVSPQIYIVSLLASCCISGNTQLVGYDPASDFSVQAWVGGGVTQPSDANDVIVGHYIITPIGAPLIFYGHEFTVAGRLEPTGMGLDRAVFIPMEGAREMILESGMKAAQKLNVEPDQISAVFVRVDRSVSTPAEVALKIQAGVPGVSVIVANQLVEGVTIHLAAITQTMLVLTVAVWALSALMVAVVFSMIVNERKREIGLLRALGATKMQIFKLVLAESVLLTSAGAAVGIAAGGSIMYVFSALIQSVLKMPYLWPSPDSMVMLVLFSIGVGLLTGLVGAFYPAWRSSRLEPLSAIRGGE
ncbi:MAG: FtsX-like permease family protein [Thaumarchaeota archaeon]|nr:FtsX-like permease family protein [Nitrososphaerota archaeon]MCL5316976.1 FtsX-like permease family protein [Nitrososphaerota archaeon]